LTAMGRARGKHPPEAIPDGGNYTTLQQVTRQLRRSL